MRLFRFLCPVLLSAPLCGVAAERPPFQVPPAVIMAKFRQLDKNGDNILSGDELAAHPLLRMLDTNGDGSVNLEEAQQAFAGLAQAAKPAAAPASAPDGASASGKPADDSPRTGPRVLRAAEAGINSRLPDVAVTDLNGKQVRLGQIPVSKGLVVALVDPDCPVSKRYVPTLLALRKGCQERGISFIFLAPLKSDDAALRTAFGAPELAGSVFLDPKGDAARALGARATTDAYVFDPARTMIYHGAVDDQYGLGYQLEAPRQKYLVAAMDAAVETRRPEIAATEAPGCLLDLGGAVAPLNTEVTYHNRISRIVQANCQECHRTGGIAPFPMETYEQVNAKAGMIRRMVSRSLMPPWFASPAGAGQHSPWANDRTLAERDRVDLLAWLDAGKPEGNAKDAPLPRTFPSEWQIGKPDLVLQIPKPMEIPATGAMRYQYQTLEVGNTDDKWVQAWEVQPTAREVVHHVLVFVQEKGKPLRQDGQLGGFFAAFVPGNSAVTYPDGLAKPLPAGSKLIFQIHYTPNGTATQDQVRIGMTFAKEPPQHIVRVTGITQRRLNIPPGSDNYSESATIPVPRPVRVLALMPHMHVRGKAFRYDVTLPDGSSKTLLDVPRYDFNWQIAYRYAEPLALPAGAFVKATGWFDNSASNPANPDPSKTVRFGEQTTDEMLIGYVEYFFTDEDARAGL